MKLIGIGGTNGSGKDTLSHMLADDSGWLFISASGDLIIPELKKRGLPLEREQMAALTAEWNRTISKGAVVDKAIEKFNELDGPAKYTGLVLSSIRHPWEVERIHQLGGQVIWVDADPKVRYERIYSRAQGDKDQKSYQQFLAEEQAEMAHAGDEATLNMAAVKAAADQVIQNNATVEDFKARAKNLLVNLVN